MHGSSNAAVQGEFVPELARDFAQLAVCKILASIKTAMQLFEYRSVR
jgi:hypothetical protein